MSFSQKIRGRRNSYRSFGNTLSAYCVQQKSLPAVKPFPAAVISGDTVPIQMYREEKGYKISDNNQFAVFDEAKPESKMFATTKAAPAKLNEDVVTFNMVDTGDYPKQYGMKEVVPDKKMTAEEIKRIHCGPFSRKATGLQEVVENENAKPGRSLFVKDFQWSEPQGLKDDNPSRGSWENHYAPVIVQDGTDRGTFETAVHIDHAYFGIYGSQKGQTFRLKTVMADIALSEKRGLLASDVAQKLREGIQNYIKGDPSGTDDEYLKKEIDKIDHISKSNPDIDQPFKERKEQEKAYAQKKQAFWNLVETETKENIWFYIKEQDNLSSSRSYLMEFSSKAKSEKKHDVDKKIQYCLQRINQELAAKSGTDSSGIGTGTLVAGAFLIAGIVWGIISFLKQGGYL